MTMRAETAHNLTGRTASPMKQTSLMVFPDVLEDPGPKMVTDLTDPIASKYYIDFL